MTAALCSILDALRNIMGTLCSITDSLCTIMDALSSIMGNLCTAMDLYAYPEGNRISSVMESMIHNTQTCSSWTVPTRMGLRPPSWTCPTSGLSATVEADDTWWLASGEWRFPDGVPGSSPTASQGPRVTYRDV